MTAANLEPGFHTIFEEASPTFKRRFMYMSGYTDEAAFDRFRKTLTWEGHAQKLRMPYLCVAGEADELSPSEHTERFMRTLRSRKRLVVYQDSRHSVGNVPSTSLGPAPPLLVACVESELEASFEVVLLMVEALEVWALVDPASVASVAASGSGAASLPHASGPTLAKQASDSRHHGPIIAHNRCVRCRWPGRRSTP